MEKATAQPGRKPGTFRAFVSYSHTDDEIARRLHRWLEAFRVPAGLPGEDEFMRPIFLDEAELPAAPVLAEKLIRALDSSDALMVVASPASAQSPWVAKEILGAHLGQLDSLGPSAGDRTPQSRRAAHGHYRSADQSDKITLADIDRVFQWLEENVRTFFSQLPDGTMDRDRPCPTIRDEPS